MHALKWILLPFAFCSSLAMATVTVQLGGMHCQSCAKGIQEKFSKQPEVKDCKVDFKTKVMTLNFKEGKDIPDNKIAELITEEGEDFKAKKIERKN